MYLWTNSRWLFNWNIHNQRYNNTTNSRKWLSTYFDKIIRHKFFFVCAINAIFVSSIVLTMKLLNLYLNSTALFLVRYFYILKWHFWDLSIYMGIFWGSWFLHSHEIPHPNQWGSMKNHKEMLFIQERPQSSRFYLYIGSERSAFLCALISLAHWQNTG